MQKCYTDMGLTVCEILTGFNNYEGAQIIGSSSQMIVLKTTTNSCAAVSGSFEKPIYTGELRKTIRNYACIECGEVFKVGSSESYITIEILKGEGCKKCGGRNFKLVDRNKI